MLLLSMLMGLGVWGGEFSLVNVDPPDKLRSLLGEGSELEHVLPCCRPGFASLYTKPGYY